MKMLLTAVASLLLFTAFAVADDDKPTTQPAEKPLRVHMISGSNEYKSEPSLKAWAAHLEEHYEIACTLSLGKDKGKDLPDIEKLKDADVMVVFCRRNTLPEEQIDIIRAHCKAGKPVIGLRTASHAFQNWKTYDRDIHGGSYSGHFGGEMVEANVETDAADHPILNGIESWERPGKLYKNPKNADDTTTLITGVGKKSKKSEPIAWVHVTEDGSRVFYTSMGYPSDFDNETFQKLMFNALQWVADRQIVEKPKDEEGEGSEE